MFLPLIFKSEGLRGLIVGGGSVALRKITALTESGCAVTVIAPDCDLSGLPEETRRSVQVIRREFQPGDCRGFDLIIAATNDRRVNESVSTEARSARIPVNVVDEPDLCSVLFPAIIRQDDLLIAVSTGGEAPFMAAEFRDRIGEGIAGWGEWLRIAANFRAVVRNEMHDPEQIKRLLVRFRNLPIVMDIAAPSAADSLNRWLEWMEKLEGC